MEQLVAAAFVVVEKLPAIGFIACAEVARYLVERQYPAVFVYEKSGIRKAVEQDFIEVKLFLEFFFGLLLIGDVA